MSSKDHSSMYKSRTGNHSKVFARGDRANDQLRRKRTDARQNVHAAHRVIEPTPKKIMQPSKPPTREIAAEHLQAAATVATEEAASGDRIAKPLSRQQAFRLKFNQYREEKAAKAIKNKAAPAPFISVVPIGRYITTNDNKTVKKPNGLLKLPSQRPLNIGKTDVIKSKYSPINTRSRKRQLVSPSQLPVPRRKSRSRADAVPLSNGNQATKLASATATTSKTPNKTPIKAPNKVPNKTPSKTPIKTPVKTPSKIQSKTPTKTPNETPNKAFKNSVKNIGRGPFSPDATLVIGTEAPFSSKNTSTVAKNKSIETAAFSKPGTSSTVSKLAFNFNDISPIEFTAVKETNLHPPTAAAEPKRRQSKLHNRSAKGPAPIEINDELNTTPLNTDDPLNNSANYVSPFVTIARGSRRSKSKEVDARNTKYTLGSRQSVLNDSVEARQNREAATYFRQQISKETERLTGLIDEWVTYKEEHLDAIPSEYMDLIDVAAGQTRLLISSKFEQFRKLTVQCEQGGKDQVVTPLDLEGFWNMVFLQVENCNKRFDRLTALKNNGWQDPDLKPKVLKKKKDPLHGVNNANGNNLKAKSVRSNSTLSKMLQMARKQFNENKNAEPRKSILASLQSEPRVSSPRKNVRKSIWIVSSHLLHIYC